MPVGLKIRNQWGSVQIDQDWRNYGYRQKVPVTLTALWNAPVNYQLVLSGSPALRVACRATQLLPVKLHSYFSGGSWFLNWRFYKELPPIADGTELNPVTETVEFFVFDVLDFGAFSNVGLRVFNPARQLVFHSDAPMMKLGYGGGGVQTCNVAFLGAPARSYVPLILRNPIYGVVATFPAGYRLRSYTLRAAGSNIVPYDRSLDNEGASGPYGNVGAYAAIDVTGLS